MVSPVSGAYDEEAMDAAAGRIQTLELLAALRRAAEAQASGAEMSARSQSRASTNTSSE